MANRDETVPPSPDEIRAALERVIASEVFRGSPQLAAFLRFVVEAVLRGESERIKGYTIAVEALGRNERFDPQADPIVRVEATRLRRAIERYYAGPGADDRVVISLQRGSYIPVFGSRAVASAGETLIGTAARRPDRARGLIWLRLALLPVGALAVFALLIYASNNLRMKGGDGVAPAREATAPSDALAAGNGMPTLLIAPFEIAGSPATRSISPGALLEKMSDAFARFDTVNVMLDSDPDAGPVIPATSGAPRRPARVDYRLSGTIESREDGHTSIRFRLVDAADGNVVWSQLFERVSSTGDLSAREDSIVVELAAKLLQPFGVIRTHERARHVATGGGDPRSRCIVEASESLRSYDPAQGARARSCLERLTIEAPALAGGFRYLAAVTLRDYQFGPDKASPENPAFERALRAARRAIELAPELARGYHTLASIQFARGDVAAALAASERAVALNRYDMGISGDYGGRLVAAGEFARGMDLLRRAADVATVRPSPHHFYLSLGSYLTGDLAEATHHANQISSENYPLGFLARALAASAAGNAERARKELAGLAGLQPAWRDDPQAQLQKFIPNPAIVERLARELSGIGFPGRT